MLFIHRSFCLAGAAKLAGLIQDGKEARHAGYTCVEAKNTADTLLHTAEKNLAEYGDKIGDDDKSAIETAVEELKEAKEGDDVEAINAKCEALSQAAMKLGEAMYKAAQAEGGADGMAGADMGGMGAGSDSQQTSSSGDDNFVDADFEEVDPDAEAKDKKDD